MKIIHNGITKLASLCRISIQVIDKYSMDDQTIDIPDDWIYQEDNKYYLTKKGWEMNKESIKNAYEKTLKYHPYTTEDNTWSVFESYAENHFKMMENKNNIIKRDFK